MNCKIASLYTSPQFHLSMDCFWCILESKNVDLNEHEDARWLTKKELDHFSS